MANRRWSVGELIELTPFEASILDYNRNAGQLIALRLRTDDLSGFRHYDSIRKVLLHELTHNVLDWTAHGGHRLGQGDFYTPTDDEEEEVGGYVGGIRRLDGGNSEMLTDTPEARRQRLAAAALSRLTKKEEQEMDEGCGSSH
ncbi:hypothetical protein A0J61_08243 [Choanephora cucurbitarum]|uniref:WLM domain-containing protein n=1 Tax=Choanephora cucurbitarum TaxID=101091 RepID=A0A1C7N3R1_9FUNG|nr:hypothetical protein A0J61_08243 [Choanephora cucurbitarum]